MTRPGGTAPATDGPLLVQVGDVIATGHGDGTNVVMIVWTNRAYAPGKVDAQGTPYEAPSKDATPVDAVCLVPPRGDGHFLGTAMRPEFLTYLGWLRPDESEMTAVDLADDDYAAREGHTWRVETPGYRRIEHAWWETFRRPATEGATG